jgi:glycosyltransferase involved in cell wall biosynthesis
MDKSTSYPKILLISSVDPNFGPAKVAMDYYRAFVQAGVDIDFLTKYPVEGWPEIKYIYKKQCRFRDKLYRQLYKFTGLNKTKPGYCFFYTYEFLPPVPVRRVLSAINKEYDLVLILFWQGMLSFSTINCIYKKLGCQIHFMGVDYSQMAGGCHFTCDCQRYQTGCGECPAIYSGKKKDFTYFNLKFRKEVYETVKPVVYGNLYMRENFYKNSYLLRNSRVEPSYDIYDMEEFYPMDKSQLRETYDIPKEKHFILFFGCQYLDDKRKGMRYLVDSLKFFWKSLSPHQRNEVLVVVAGKNTNEILSLIDFDSKDVGYVPVRQMPELYSLADVFLSPSIDDAGPMMVNQSLCCGTPVVAFEMGTALESIKDKPTGYCAKMKDSEDFAKGIEYVYKLSNEERQQMQSKCREYAINTFSYAARVKTLLSIFEKYNV